MKKTEGGTTMYYVTFGPDIIAEYTGSGTLVMEHIYASGGRIATVIPRE